MIPIKFFASLLVSKILAAKRNDQETDCPNATKGLKILLAFFEPPMRRFVNIVPKFFHHRATNCAESIRHNLLEKQMKHDEFFGF